MFSFYADESGDLGSRDEWIVLLAVGFPDHCWPSIDDSIRRLKKTFFPGIKADNAEIKSVYLRRWNQPDKPWPPNPFALLKENEVRTFADQLYDLTLNVNGLEWAAAAINKPAIRRRDGIVEPRGLFLRAYTLLCERIQGWLAPQHGVDSLGRLFLDQQHETIVNYPHAEIIARHHQLKSVGSGFQVCDRIIEQPFFMQSQHSSHIQVADVFAYNVLRQLRDFRGKQLTNYRFFEKIMPKCRGYQSWNTATTETPYGLKIYP